MSVKPIFVIIFYVQRYKYVSGVPLTTVPVLLKKRVKREREGRREGK
jgi:hypothetical protein